MYLKFLNRLPNMKWIQIPASFCLIFLLTNATAQQSETLSLGKVKMVFTLDQKDPLLMKSLIITSLSSFLPGWDLNSMWTAFFILPLRSPELKDPVMIKPGRRSGEKQKISETIMKE
jgi:hypothetical protein